MGHPVYGRPAAEDRAPVCGWLDVSHPFPKEISMLQMSEIGEWMKNFDSRVYSINDFLEWSNANQLELSPKFQRRSVWNDNAKSYLMDTIVRGKPIPKVFIRQKINPVTKLSVREVVDGQQRLRTILSYIKDGFQISKKHNKLYGGFYFSQLSEVDDNIQTNILNYEVSVDLLVNMPDSEVLDVFGRLNSYAVVLNAQEKINADHFSPFKTLADALAHRYNDFWLKNGLLTSAVIMRMKDVTLAADLLIAGIEGIKGTKQIKFYYDRYEQDFPHDVERLDAKFTSVITDINNTFQTPLKGTHFSRAPLFYSLFTSLWHLRYGVPGLNAFQLGDFQWNWPRLRSGLKRIEDILDAPDRRTLPEEDQKFLEDVKLATTDAAVRLRRTQFFLSKIAEVFI
jgi:hypothetical protein